MDSPPNFGNTYDRRGNEHDTALPKRHGTPPDGVTAAASQLDLGRTGDHAATRPVIVDGQSHMRHEAALGGTSAGSRAGAAGGATTGRSESTDASVDRPASETAGADGVYDITKSTEHWFNLEVHQLEKHAREEGARWGEKGLPRHDLKMEGPLPVEAALAARAVEIFRQWAIRVQVKMKDAVVERTQGVRADVSAFRTHLDALRETRAELRRAMRDRDDIRREARREPSSIGYGRLLGNFWFWCLMILLVAVDFVANVPVFRELLPPDALADRMYRQLAGEAELHGLWSGLYRIWAGIATYPDASILAAGVIILLVFLGDRIGVGARTLAAFRTSDAPALAQGMKRHRRQSVVPLVLSVVGAAAVIAVLFMSRERILDKAEERLAADSLRLGEISGQLAGAEAVRDMQAVSELTREMGEVRAVMRDHEDRVAYAATIQAMNLPILLLNISLLLAAAVAGYTSHREKIGESRGEDPRLMPINARVDVLRLEALRHRERMWETAREADRRLTTLRHLLRARPLQGWEGKAERLSRVVDVFRAENARHRGMDPASIPAFRETVPMELSELNGDAPLVNEPEDLPLLEIEYARLRLELEQIRPEADLEVEHA